MKILVTGTAGFIGFFTAKKLLETNNDIIGIDNINDYYDQRLKNARLYETGVDPDLIDYNKEVQSIKYPGYRFIKINLEDKEALSRLFEKEHFDKVCHLAAQAGVRYSIDNPKSYINSNLVGFANILECCRYYDVKHLIYASSSSVYGGNDKVPYSEDDRVDNPISLYAATKRANELLANVYARLYGISATGLRFFTVYGPWGRPDMAPFLFAKAISCGESIKVFNNGNLSRDFTYIDDIVEGIVKVVNNNPEQPENRIYNIGCSHPVNLMEFIETLEKAIGKPAKKMFLPMQPGDVYQTYADTSKLERDFGYKPTTSISEGIRKFIQWYQSDLNPLK
jgi:UDP-glucuronate 4-epimerase